MSDILKALGDLKIDSLFILAGLVFVFVGVVGNISGKINPSKMGRLAAIVVGALLIAAGVWMHTPAGTGMSLSDASQTTQQPRGASAPPPPHESTPSPPSPPPQQSAPPSPSPQQSAAAPPAPLPHQSGAAPLPPSSQHSDLATQQPTLGLRPRTTQQPGRGIDCRAQNEPIQVLICADADLAEWDGRMYAKYTEKRQDGRDVQRFTHEQVTWLAFRDAQCGIPKKGNHTAEQLAFAKPCVLRMMMDRVKELDSK
jgi:uncharacterized protein YecT (DUF1311 family)